MLRKGPRKKMFSFRHYLRTNINITSTKPSPKRSLVLPVTLNCTWSSQFRTLTGCSKKKLIKNSNLAWLLRRKRFSVNGKGKRKKKKYLDVPNSTLLRLFIGSQSNVCTCNYCIAIIVPICNTKSRTWNFLKTFINF